MPDVSSSRSVLFSPPSHQKLLNVHEFSAEKITMKKRRRVVAEEKKKKLVTPAKELSHREEYSSESLNYTSGEDDK